VTVTRTTTKTPVKSYQFKVGNKKITLTPKQVDSIKSTPTMKQLDKFRSMVKKQNGSANEDEIISAFRKMLSSEARGFKFSPRGNYRTSKVESQTIGDIPT